MSAVSFRVNGKHLTLAAAASLSGFALLMPAAAPAAQGKESAETAATDASKISSPADTADASMTAVAEGAAVFGQRCRGCHTVESAQISYGGPNLAGVVGRPAATARFRYSSAMRNAGLTWTREQLDAFLAAQMAKVPGTSMVISLTDAGQRQAVIEFLNTTSSE